MVSHTLYACGGAQSKHDGMSMERFGDVGTRVYICMYGESGEYGG